MSPTYREREAKRARSGRANPIRDHGEGCTTGHPALFAVVPAFELGRMPEGGGYPVGFLEMAFRLMDVTEPAEVLHLCSGSVRATRTIDIRPEMPATIRADVRWLPIRPASIRWAIADPPYGQDYAEQMWGLGREYPAPIVLLREVAGALVDGGLVGYVDTLVPQLPDELERVSVTAFYCGTLTRVRALTICRRRSRTTSLMDEAE